MAQYNTLNVKLSNSQLNKLKPEIKNVVKVTFSECKCKFHRMLLVILMMKIIFLINCF